MNEKQNVSTFTERDALYEVSMPEEQTNARGVRWTREDYVFVIWGDYAKTWQVFEHRSERTDWILEQSGGAEAQ